MSIVLNLMCITFISRTGGHKVVYPFGVIQTGQRATTCKPNKSQKQILISTIFVILCL